MIVWLASYPRSGNTFFRVIMNSVFGIKTYSIYNDTSDIGADERTSEIVGHEFLPKNFDLAKARASKEIYYIKTHELIENIDLDSSDKVIYLVRDGRESSLSFTKYLKNFHNGDGTLADVLYGNIPFGTWGEHVRQWAGVDKLVIHFETLTKDPSSMISSISKYLDIQTVNDKIPTFDELNKINPKFFNSGKTDSWKTHYTKDEHLFFWASNINEMLLMGYKNDMPEEIEGSIIRVDAAQLEKHIQSLRDTFRIKADSVRISLTKQLENKQQEIVRLNAENKKKREEIERLNAENQQRQKEVERLNVENQQRQKEVERLNVENRKRQEEIERLNAENQQRQEEAERLNVENRKRQEKINDIYASKKYKLAVALASPYIKAKQILKSVNSFSKK